MFGKIQCIKEKVQFVYLDAKFILNPNTNEKTNKKCQKCASCITFRNELLLCKS